MPLSSSSSPLASVIPFALLEQLREVLEASAYLFSLMPTSFQGPSYDKVKAPELLVWAV